MKKEREERAGLYDRVSQPFSRRTYLYVVGVQEMSDPTQAPFALLRVIYWVVETWDMGMDSQRVSESPL